MAADYLDGGVEALWPRLAKSSDLSDSEVRREKVELSVRLGPVSGTKWELAHLAGQGGDRYAAFQVTYASGIMDVLVFDVDIQSGHLRSVRSLVEPRSPGTYQMARLANLRTLLARGDVLMGEGRGDEVERLLRARTDPRATSQQARFEAAVRRLWLAQYRLLRADAEGAWRARDSGSPSGSRGQTVTESTFTWYLRRTSTKSMEAVSESSASSTDGSDFPSSTSATRERS
ncbi:MAG: hypothetical protein MPN21_13970 [Thermoanaerobaculia bacterium]|nr:hypothetical protein [Thermoanaerobaculia bacterium]